MEPFWAPKGGSIEPLGVRWNLFRGSIEPSGGFDRTFLGRSPISGYRVKIPSKKAENFAGKLCRQSSLRNSPAIFPKFARPKQKNSPPALQNLGINTWFSWQSICDLPAQPQTPIPRTIRYTKVAQRSVAGSTEKVAQK